METPDYLSEVKKSYANEIKKLNDELRNLERYASQYDTAYDYAMRPPEEINSALVEAQKEMKRLEIEGEILENQLEAKKLSRKERETIIGQIGDKHSNLSKLRGETTALDRILREGTPNLAKLEEEIVKELARQSREFPSFSNILRKSGFGRFLSSGRGGFVSLGPTIGEKKSKALKDLTDKAAREAGEEVVGKAGKKIIIKVAGGALVIVPVADGYAAYVSADPDLSPELRTVRGIFGAVFIAELGDFVIDEIRKTQYPDLKLWRETTSLYKQLESNAQLLIDIKNCRQQLKQGEKCDITLSALFTEFPGEQKTYTANLDDPEAENWLDFHEDATKNRISKLAQSIEENEDKLREMQLAETRWLPGPKLTQPQKRAVINVLSAGLTKGRELSVSPNARLVCNALRLGGREISSAGSSQSLCADVSRGLVYFSLSSIKGELSNLEKEATIASLRNWMRSNSFNKEELRKIRDNPRNDPLVRAAAQRELTAKEAAGRTTQETKTPRQETEQETEPEREPTQPQEPELTPTTPLLTTEPTPVSQPNGGPTPTPTPTPTPIPTTPYQSLPSLTTPFSQLNPLLRLLDFVQRLILR